MKGEEKKEGAQDSSGADGIGTQEDEHHEAQQQKKRSHVFGKPLHLKNWLPSFHGSKKDHDHVTTT